jgi:hypothetical protein
VSLRDFIAKYGPVKVEEKDEISSESSVTSSSEDSSDSDNDESFDVPKPVSY